METPISILPEITGYMVCPAPLGIENLELQSVLLEDTSARTKRSGRAMPYLTLTDRNFQLVGRGHAGSRGCEPDANEHNRGLFVPPSCVSLGMHLPEGEGKNASVT